MALMTMIARVVDGLPLVGTMAEDEQVSKLSKTEKESFLITVSHSLTVRKKYSGISKPGQNVIP